MFQLLSGLGNLLLRVLREIDEDASHIYKVTNSTFQVRCFELTKFIQFLCKSAASNDRKSFAYSVGSNFGIR